MEPSAKHILVTWVCNAGKHCRLSSEYGTKMEKCRTNTAVRRAPNPQKRTMFEARANCVCQSLAGGKGRGKLLCFERSPPMGGGSWDSGAYWGFGCRIQVWGGVMGFWSHLGIWLSGIGGRGGHGTLEPPGDLAVGYRGGGVMGL